jgi:hypothetical protein
VNDVSLEPQHLLPLTLAGARSRRLWLAVLLTLAAAEVGCGGAPNTIVPNVDAAVFDSGVRPDAGVFPSSPDGGLKLDLACALLNARRCAALERCGLVGSAALGTCVDTLTQTWCGPTTWPAHVAQGALRYDPLVARQCADAFLTSTCANSGTLPEACGRFLLPNAGLRAACFDGFAECTDGVCRGAACPRTCQARGLVGEVCASDTDCQPTFFCRLSTTTAGVGQCQPWLRESDSCDLNSKCAQPLVCAQNKCQRLPTTGQPCPLGLCDEVSQCVSAVDGGQCIARADLAMPCTAGSCLPDLVCDPQRGVCLPAAVAVAGDPCTLLQSCPAANSCVGAQSSSPGVCTAPLVAGAACQHDDECAVELACVTVDGGRACGRRLAWGAACTTDRACQLDATCTGGVCTRAPGPGEACTDRCRVGTCVANPNADAGGRLCAPWLGPGVACVEDGQCESRRCVSRRCLTACVP